jgi:hypothetical protein
LIDYDVVLLFFERKRVLWGLWVWETMVPPGVL